MINCETNKWGIKKLLQTEMLDFTAPIIVNNLPSIDGLLVSQREVIWGMYKGHKTSDKPTFKMLKCGGNVMDYYVLGDMPLYGVMKNMGNNYTLNKYLKTKGQFGDKNKKNGKGAAPRYIECTLNKYSESMLSGIKYNVVPMKNNYDFTEKEPVVMPSIIPNILTNLRMSIAVSEANSMPSHNMTDVKNSIVSYIKTKDIDKSIELLKVPDLPTGGSIVYDKKLFNSIYKTGRGSFPIIGNYKYNEKENTIYIYEIPYTTFIENIEQEIEDKIDKFKNLIKDYHNGSDKDGIKLELYLKNGVNPDLVIQTLRKHTSFEDKFSCNFTILDLDGKTPKLMNLEDIITRWIIHRQNCIKNELSYKINLNKIELNKLYGLKIINSNLDETIQIIRSSKTEKIASESLEKRFDLNKEQSEYISSIKLIKLNKEWVSNKLDNIEILENKNKEYEDNINNPEWIDNKIIEQLEEVEQQFGQPRKTQIIYNDTIGSLSDSQDIEDYNCSIAITEQGYIKKTLSHTDKHRLKDGDVIIDEFKCNNRDTLIFLTDKGNRIKAPVNSIVKLDQPSKSLGDFIPTLMNDVTSTMKEGFSKLGEQIVKIIAIPEKAEGYVIMTYETGNIAKIPANKLLKNVVYQKNCYNLDSKLLDIKYIDNDVDVLFMSEEGKGLIINTSKVNKCGTPNSQGVGGMKTVIKKNIKDEEGNIIDTEIITETKCLVGKIGVNKDNHIIITNTNNLTKEFLLDDVVPNTEDKQLYKHLYSNARDRQGNFVWNTRNVSYGIKSITIE